MWMPVVIAGIKYLPKADGKGSAEKYGRLTNKNGQPTKNIADRPTLLAGSKKQGQWPQAMAGEMWGWPTSHSLLLKSKTQVFGAKPNTKQASQEVLRQGA